MQTYSPGYALSDTRRVGKMSERAPAAIFRLSLRYLARWRLKSSYQMAPKIGQTCESESSLHGALTILIITASVLGPVLKLALTLFQSLSPFGAASVEASQLLVVASRI